MAIEALGGVMSYQTQAVTPVKPAQNETGHTESGLQNISVNVDTKTAAVAKSQESGSNGQGGGENAGGQQSNTEQLKKAISELNKSAGNTQVQFGIHEDTNRVTIKIVDKDSHKTVKEFPAEKTLDMIAKVWELAGILVDEKR